MLVFSELNFLYVLFPLCMALYLLSRSLQGKNAVLLLFSLIFYAWGEPAYVLLLVGMALADWILAIGIGRTRGTGRDKLFLVLACAVNLGLIGFFKYTNFFADTLYGLFGKPSPVAEIMLPIGISFYTFQLLSYVVDVYRGEVQPQRRFWILLLYASLFHQCIAGPIVRYADVEQELLHRETNPSEVSAGVTRFTVGLAKKTMLANVCEQLIQALLGKEMTAETLSHADGAALWVAMLAFSLQIYLDFSAYSDMAIGMGQMVGLHYKENFNYPYISRSITDFWRRWHISLSTFFRDYVYIPLGGNRKGLPRQIFNLLIVWLLTGLWHGASWNFVLWGLYFFVFLVLEKLFLGRLLQKLPAVISWVYSMFVVFCGWVLFKFENFDQLKAVAGGMVGLNGNYWTGPETNTVILNYLFFLIAALIAVTPLARNLNRLCFRLSLENRTAAVVYRTVQVLGPVLLLVLSTMMLVGNTVNPFLYTKF